MATPAFSALRRHFVDAEIVGVCRPYVAGVVEASPWFDRLTFLDVRGPWSQRWPAVAWSLRRQRPDLTLLLPNSHRSALAPSLAASRRTIGYERLGRGWMLHEALPVARDA